MFPHSYTFPHMHSWIFEALRLIISWVWVICKRLNVNWKKIQSVILSLTCHCLINFPPLIHIPLYAFINFWNPTSYIFFSLSHLKKRWNVNWKKIPTIMLSVTCNSLWIFPPLIHIPHIHLLIYLKPFKLLFHVFESFIKGQMWIGKKFTQ